MAHIQIHLMMLPSGPDMVRSRTLHKTLKSTPKKIKILYKQTPLSQPFSPAYSWFQVQGTTNSPPSTVQVFYQKK